MVCLVRLPEAVNLIIFLIRLVHLIILRKLKDFSMAIKIGKQKEYLYLFTYVFRISVFCNIFGIMAVTIIIAKHCVCVRSFWREWFEDKDVLDVGCNAGHVNVTLCVCS